MTCDRFVEVLMDLLEGDADAPTAAVASAHAAGCADCRDLLRDLERVRDEAARLPVVAPSRDLWAGIDERIAAPVLSLRGATAAAERAPAGGQIARRTAMLAAAGLVFVTAGVTWLATRAGAPALLPASPPAVASVPTSESAPVATVAMSRPSPDDSTMVPTRSASVGTAPVRGTSARSPAGDPVVPMIAVSAGEAYDAEIARLRAIVDAQRPRLDTATIGVIDRNLRLIDDAIFEVRNALTRDPASRFLMESLSSVYQRKMQLLRSAAALEGTD